MIAEYGLVSNPGTTAAIVSCPSIEQFVTAVPAIVQSADAGSSAEQPFYIATGNQAKITHHEEHHLAAWSPYVESLFQGLVANRAHRTITPEGSRKLAWLRSERERLGSTLPAEQVLRDFKAGELRRKATRALFEYAEFIKNPADNSKA